MRNLIVASAQQQMRLFDSIAGFSKELNRFLYMARVKGAELVVFPALAGIMAASPLVEGFGVNLLKQGKDRRRGSIWTRTRSSLASSTALLFGANFRKAFEQLLQADPQGLLSTYEMTFSKLAETYQVTIVAGSAYLPDAAGIIRHRATVFGPNGSVLGRHNKLSLSAEEQGLATAGDAWTVVGTPVGQIGLLLGEEVLYPEAGRILAYQGAEILVTLAATGNEAMAAYVRQATLARAQENQCFGLTSFLVGRNYLAPREDRSGTLVGKSGIYAPLEMTPHNTGVLVEMGTASTEGLLTAELDRRQLRAIWESGVEPVRSRMPANLFANYLPALYSSRRTLTDTWFEAEPAEAVAPPALPPASIQREPASTPEMQPGPQEPVEPLPEAESGESERDGDETEARPA